MTAPRSGDQAHAARLLGLLAEPDRLRVAAALVLGATTLTRIRELTGADTRDAATALARLEAGGLAYRDGGAWYLAADQLKWAAAAAAPPTDTDDHGARDPTVAGVLRTFLRDGALISIPTARGKRRVVLDHLVRVFEVGRRYPEPEVDAALRAFHPDYASLRRHLVDEQFLERSAGIYWRIGGTVEV
ncbi:MAG TPA: DUF2087 domain-containing protein [Mycobacteriales bacterium]|jgi:hypothetical protein|nr:DUF2087 domain-containing protein [Mycobacteriales bacterium]